MKTESFLSKIEYPNEHGAWVLLVQTTLIGLVLSFSIAACWAGVAFWMLFLGSRSLRIVLAALAEKRATPRVRSARKALVFYGGLSLAAAIVFLTLSSWEAWLPPLLLVSPACVVLLRAHSDRRDRELIPELAATVFITVLLPIMLLVGGAAAPLVYATWVAWLAHTLLAVFYVRARFRRERGKEANIAAVFIFCGTAWLALLAAYFYNSLSFIALLGFAALTVRLAVGLLGAKRVTPPKVLGWQETFWGTFYAACLILGFLV